MLFPIGMVCIVAAGLLGVIISEENPDVESGTGQMQWTAGRPAPTEPVDPIHALLLTALEQPFRRSSRHKFL